MHLRTCCTDYVREITQGTLAVDKDNREEGQCPECHSRFLLTDACDIMRAKRKKKQRKAEENRRKHRKDQAEQARQITSQLQLPSDLVGVADNDNNNNLFQPQDTMRQVSLYVVTLIHYPNSVAALLNGNGTADHAGCKLKLSYHAGSEREARDKVRKRFAPQLCYRMIKLDESGDHNKENVEFVLMNTSPYVIEKVSRFSVTRTHRNPYIVQRDWEKLRGNKSASHTAKSR